MQLQNDTQSNAGEMDVKFQLAKDTLETMLRSMSCIRDQLSDDVCLQHRDLFFLLDVDALAKNPSMYRLFSWYE